VTRQASTKDSALRRAASWLAGLLLSFCVSAAILWMAFPVIFRDYERVQRPEWACYCQIKTGTSLREKYLKPVPSSFPLSKTVDRLPDDICHKLSLIMLDSATLVHPPPVFARLPPQDVPCDPQKMVPAFAVWIGLGLLILMCGWFIKSRLVN
jgi:hypothetical protein